MKRGSCILLTILLLLTLIPGSAEQVGSETLTVANATKVSGAFFTRQFGNNTCDIDVRAMVHGYDPIVWTSQLSYETDPMVVEKMTGKETEAGTIYTFTLCRDLKWNDGTPVTAKDYVFAYALQASPEFEAIGGDTDVWQHIVGYEEYANGKSESFSGVRLLGDYSYSVTVKSEYLPYFYEYTYLSVTPCPADVLAPGCVVADEGNGVYIRNEDEEVTEKLFTEELIRTTILDAETGYLSYPDKTSGPYSLVSYDSLSGTVEFEKNPYYKGDYEGNVPSIEKVRLITAPAEELPGMLASGEIDILNKAVRRDLIEECRTEAEGIGSEIYPRLGYGALAVSCERGPQQSPAVRQAIALAFDTDTFVREQLGGYGLAVYGYYGLGQWMTQAALGTLRLEIMTEEETERWDALNLDALDHYEYDPDAALNLLVSDGWTLNADGADFDPENDTVRYKETEEGLMALSFRFGLTTENATAAAVLETLRRGLEPLGAEITVDEQSFPVILADYLRETGEREYDLSFLAYNFSSVFDPFVEIYAMGDYTGSQNAMGIADEELVKLAEELHHTEPGMVTDYLERWVAFQERYNTVLPSIPLYTDVYYDFFRSDLQNYHPAAEANWPEALLKTYIAEPEEEAEETPEDETEELPEEEPAESETDTVIG